MPSKRNTTAIDSDSEAAETDKPTPKKMRVRGRGKHLSVRQRAQVQATFLDAFAKTANVTESCEIAGIHRSTVYDWQEHDEAFSLQYHVAEAEANDRIRTEIRRRAIDGWDEDVYQLGHFAGKVRKYSDTLLIFHAKARMPEYRDKLDVKAQVQAGASDGTDDTPEAAALARGFLLGLGSLATRRVSDPDGPGVSGE